jgi:uncharacterized membrane protein YfcA
VELVLLAAGAIAGGFINGLTGFGFALMSAGFWLLILPPTSVVPLMAVCMTASQLMTLPRIWRMIDAKRAVPLTLGGFVGIPIGIAILPLIPLPAFKILVASLIVLNLVYVLTLQSRFSLPKSAERFHIVAGFIGGIFGGISALSGVVTTIWSGLFGWTKQEKRGVFQAFNLSMGILSLVLFAYWGFLDKQFFYTAGLAIPLTLLAASIGVRVFERMGNAGFTKLINILLALSATNLVISVLTAS